MKKIKIILNIVLLVGMLYCDISFVKLITENMHGKIINEEQMRGKPIGIAVDSKQNIYIGGEGKGREGGNFCI